MPTKQEINQAYAWMAKHGYKLPKMSDGERINYDPIIYFPSDQTWRLKALQVQKHQNILDELTPEEERLRGMLFALYVKAVVETKLNMKHIAFLIFLLFGFSVQKISNTTGIPKQTVSDSIKRAISLLSENQCN